MILVIRALLVWYSNEMIQFSAFKVFICQYFTDTVGPYLIIDESPMIGDNFTGEFKLD